MPSPVSLHLLTQKGRGWRMYFLKNKKTRPLKPTDELKVFLSLLNSPSGAAEQQLGCWQG